MGIFGRILKKYPLFYRILVKNKQVFSFLLFYAQKTCESDHNLQLYFEWKDKEVGNTVIIVLI